MSKPITAPKQTQRSKPNIHAASSSVPAVSNVRLKRTSMAVDMTYHEESHTRKVRSSSFTVTNLTPMHNDFERAKVKREIEKTLYRVFSKYAKEP